MERIASPLRAMKRPRSESCVLAQSIQRRHKGVPLLSPFALRDFVGPSLIVEHVRGVLVVERLDKRKERRQSWVVLKCFPTSISV